MNGKTKMASAASCYRRSASKTDGKKAKKLGFWALAVAMILASLIGSAMADHVVDEGTLRNSNIDVDYKGLNTYTVSLTVRDEDNNRVYMPLERIPVVRLTSECAGSIFSYCYQDEHTHHADMDWVKQMSYAGEGVYTSTFDFEDHHGTVTPLVYALYDSNINQNLFKAGSNMRHSDQYIPATTFDLSAETLLPENHTETEGVTTLFSSLLIPPYQQDLRMRIQHDNCASVTINGRNYYTSDPDMCQQGLFYNVPITMSVDPYTPLVFELEYTQKMADSDLTFMYMDSENSFTWTAFSTDIYRPLIFSESVGYTFTYGDPPTPGYVKAIAGLIVAFTAIGLLTAWYTQEKYNKRMQGHYSIIIHIQTLMFTPLIGISIGQNVLNFYDFLDCYLFNFNFLGQGVVFTDNGDNSNSYNFPQTNPYLETIGLESASALYNLGQVLFVLCLLGVVYLVVNWLYYLTYNRDRKESNWDKAMKYLHQSFHFSVLIRFFMLVFLFLWMCAMTEIGESNEDIEKGGSWTFAFLLMITLFVSIFLAFVHYISTKDQKKKNERVEELFRGTKENNNLARLWPIVWMARTAFFLVIVSTMNNDSRYGELSIVFVAQIIYVLWVAATMPFTEWVDYAIEILNGVMFLVALVALYGLDKRDNWSDGVDHMYLAFICITAGINCLLIIAWASGSHLNKDKQPAKEDINLEKKGSISMEIEDDDAAPGSAVGALKSPTKKMSKTVGHQDPETKRGINNDKNMM
jgi:hypothetical protein